MDHIEYIEENVKKVVATGEFPLDGLRMSEEEQRQRIFDMLEKDGYDLGDRENLEIGYEGADNYDDGQSVKFVVTRTSLEIVPYKVEKNEIFTGSFLLDGQVLTIDDQRNKVYEMMRFAGVDFDDTDELEIKYEGANSFEDGMSTDFKVSKVTKKRLANTEDITIDSDVVVDRRAVISDDLAPEEVIVQEVEMEEIVNGSINVDGLNSQEEFDNKIVYLLNNSGLEIENVGELNFSYGEITSDGKMPFSVSRVIIEDVKYRIEKELIGSGISRDGVDVYAEIQRNYGLDVRNDPNYEIIYGKEKVDTQEYRLVKIKRTRLGVINERLDNSSKLKESVSEFENALNDVSELLADRGKVSTLKKKTTELESMASEGMTEKLKKALDELTEEIRTLQTSVGQTASRYEETLANMQTLMNEEIDNFEAKGILSDDELIEFRTKYIQKRLEENFNAISIKKDIQLMRRELTSLVRRKNMVEHEVLRAQNFGLTEEKFKEIEKILAKSKVSNAILERKGLGDILAKKVSERTEEEKQILQGAREDITTEVVEARRSDADSSILDMIDALYNIDTKDIMQQEAREVKTYEKDLEAIRDNVTYLPEKIVANNKRSINSYDPLEAPEDMVEVMEARESKTNVKDQIEKLLIYKNLDDGSYYARENVFKRFNARKQSDEVKIDNASFYKMDDDDLDFIVGNADNDYSPYIIENREFELSDNKNIGVQTENVKTRDVKELFKPRNDNLERIVIYVDLENDGARYVRKNVFDRFNAKKLGEEVKINNALCYRISNEDSEFIIGNAINDYSPYIVEMREVHFNGKNGTTDEIPETKGKDSLSLPATNSQEKIKKETIIIYRDISDNNQLYASSSILNKFGIKPTGSMTKIKGRNCYKIDEATDAKINKLAKESENPIYDVKYVDLKVKRKSKKSKEKDNSSLESDIPKPHVEAILDKLTTDLDIRAKDCKKFMNANIHVAENFKNELKSGNVHYNIIHFIPTVLKTGFSFLRKMAAKLMLSSRGKESMNELKRRLDVDLTEEELDVLFDEYRGSQLKTDMNNQFNGLILEKLRAHGLAKVEIMNQNIKNSYAHLFALLGQIKSIENAINEDELDDSMKKSLMVERKSLIDSASGCIKDILINRKDANNLLSGGVHGLEEDFKAVATKLSYVGMRFAKTNKFDNELQRTLGTYGQGLNDALAMADNEAIVDNFMGLESCYFDNTQIAKSVFGKRSVGSKYYSPIAEQFDYRDDPFCTDVCTNLAFISAGLSAYTAVRVHQIEAKELLKTQQDEATNINASNDSIMDYVHETGKTIEGKREAFQEGMKAQSHQDVLNSANAIERAELDMHNWRFGDAYRAADKQGHEFFNGFHKDVSSQINDITARYGMGDLTQAGALQEFANVANNAQETLNNVSKECLNILNGYAKTHPNFDLTGIKESLDYVIAHPDAIVNMNNSMVDVTNLAGGLEGLAANHMSVLESLPSDMASTLICAASASALALRVSKIMSKKYSKKSGYGNEVTEMMDDYLNSQFEAEDEYNDSYTR